MLSCFNGDPGIICFKHCTSKVFCFNLPDKCPSCKLQLDEKDFKLLPFRLPYPFCRASQQPCSIVLRPTTGDFLNDYNNSKDLHIAVTTSQGVIVEFDQNGLQKHLKRTNTALTLWSQCLLVENVPEPWYELWDDVLNQICEQSIWSKDHYDEETYNCYTFVLTFLKSLSYDTISQSAHNKTAFCEKYIVPKATTAGKYISLYRKIRDYKFYVHSVDDSTKSNSNSARGKVSSKLFTIEE